MAQIRLYKVSFLLILALVSTLVQTAIIDNCINYTTQQKPELQTCTECRSGFFLKQSSCSDCKLSAVAEQLYCRIFVASNYGANYVDQKQNQNQQNQRISTQSINSSDANQITSITTEHQMFDNTEQNQQKKIKQKLFFQSILQSIMNDQPTENITKPDESKQNQTNNQTIQSSVLLTKQNSVPSEIASKEDENKISETSEQPKIQTKQKNAYSPLLSQNSDSPLYDLKKIDLTNCKMVDTNTGECLHCYSGFQAGSDGVCSRKNDPSMKAKQNDKNCLVFSQIQNACLQCDKQMIIDEKGHCVEKKVEDKNQGGVIIITDNLLNAKGEKPPALQIKSIKQVKPKQQAPKKSQQGYIFKPKHMEDTISLWSLSSQPLTLTLTLSDDKSHLHELKVLTNSSPQNIKPTQISIDVDNTITKVTVKAEKDPYSESQGCMQWVDKSCVVCKQGYFMNVLVNQCLMIAPYIEIPKSASITLKMPTNAGLSPQNVSLNNTNQSNSQRARAQIPQKQGQMADMISLKVGNQLINVAIPTNSVVQTPSQAKDNSTDSLSANSTHTSPGNITSNVSIPNIANETSATKTINNTITNTSNITMNIASTVDTTHIANAKNILNASINQRIQASNTTTPTLQINKVNATTTNQSHGANITKFVSSSNTSNVSSNASVHVQTHRINASTPAIPSSPQNLSTPTNSSQGKSQIVSITISTTQNKISNIQAKAGAGIVIEKCYKYKENNQQQCLQCDPGFYLYTGKCYDPIKYRALIKTKMILTPGQLGSNSLDGIKAIP